MKLDDDIEEEIAEVHKLNEAHRDKTNDLRDLSHTLVEIRNPIIKVKPDEEFPDDRTKDTTVREGVKLNQYTKEPHTTSERTFILARCKAKRLTL